MRPQQLGILEFAHPNREPNEAMKRVDVYTARSGWKAKHWHGGPYVRVTLQPEPPSGLSQVERYADDDGRRVVGRSGEFKKGTHGTLH